VIAGAIVGNVTASESVGITREGRMVGDINAPRVIIVDGASFRGRIDMGEVDVEAERENAHRRRAPRAAARSPGAPPGAPPHPDRQAGGREDRRRRRSGPPAPLHPSRWAR
jgi:hypothetical protein